MCADSYGDPSGFTGTPEGWDVLTADEQRIVRALTRLAKDWPSNLIVFGGGGSLSLRRDPGDGGFVGWEYEVASIPGIRNDGGDGGDRRG